MQLLTQVNLERDNIRVGDIFLLYRSYFRDRAQPEIAELTHNNRCTYQMLETERLSTWGTDQYDAFYEILV